MRLAADACAAARSARVKTTLRALIAAAAKGSDSGSDGGEGEWEEAGEDETAEALAALDIAKPEEAKAKAGAKKR